MDQLFRRLESEVDTAVRRLEAHPRARRVLDGSATPQMLAQFYVSARETVCMAPRFLCDCHERLRHEQAHPELIRFIAEKVEEERGHDLWVTDDLAAIGYAESSLQPAPACELYNAFHTRVIPLCGAAFLGTAWVLESLSVRCAGVAAENLRAAANIPGISGGSTAGVTFLASHHAADIGHVADMAERLERWLTDPLIRDYVLLCARFTATIYVDFFGAE